MKLAAVLLALTLTACASPFANAAHVASASATKAALHEATSPAETKRIDALTASVTGAALDTADSKGRVVVADMGAALRGQLDAALADLPARVRAIVRAALDEALGQATVDEVAGLRETLVGPALCDDIDKAIAGVGPALSTELGYAVAPTLAAAGAEAAKWKTVAEWTAVAGVVLLALLLFALHELRAHRRTLDALVKRIA